MRVTAGCKHFDVHGGPENIPVSRKNFNAKVKIRVTLLDTVYSLQFANI